MDYSSSTEVWSQTHYELLLYVVSSLVALPATIFFLFASIRGVFLILSSVRRGFIKSLFLLFSLAAVFFITYYYFQLDVSLSKIYQHEDLGFSSLFQLQATSSHTLCFVLGVATAQWVISNTQASSSSHALCNMLMMSLFFIGCFTWFYFFFADACFVVLQIKLMPVTISQACSSALSHWLSYFVGRTMLYDYYSRGFEKSGKEYAVLQYYTICGIALSCLPHAWKAVHLHIGIDSTNPLLSPSLWSFLSIFLFSYVSTRRLGYYAIVLFALSTTTMFSDIEVTHDTTNVKFPELYSALVELFDKPEVLRVLALVVMGTFIFALVAEFFILLTSKERDPRISDKKSQSLQNERILRAKNFPPIYPNGWYRAFNSEDIQIGESKYIKIFGKDIAVFRGEDGKVNAIDAFCPHLGANLGIGGKVKGNCVECPFHGWKFDGKGTCTSIPYTTSKIPNAANTNSWPVHEYADMICIFYHCEGEEPDYFPIPLPEIDNGSMARYHIWQSDLDMHIQDFAENAADYAHFNYVHDDLSIPFGAGLFYITHKVVWHSGTPSDSSQTRFSYFTDDTRVHCKFLFNIPLPQYVQPIVLFNGPSIVYFRFITPLGDILLLKTFQALGPLKVKVQDRIYADRLIPSFLVRFVVTQALHAFLDDVIIWENKSYSFRPCIVKGDGPMGKVRRWFSQFYTENSITVKQEKQNTLEW